MYVCMYVCMYSVCFWSLVLVTLPSTNTVSPRSTTLLTHPFILKPANGVHWAFECWGADGITHSSSRSTSMWVSCWVRSLNIFNGLVCNRNTRSCKMAGRQEHCHTDNTKMILSVGVSMGVVSYKTFSRMHRCKRLPTFKLIFAKSVSNPLTTPIYM